MLMRLPVLMSRSLSSNVQVHSAGILRQYLGNNSSLA